MKARTIRELKSIREDEPEDTIWKAHYFLSIKDIEDIIEHKIHELEHEVNGLGKNTDERILMQKKAQIEILKNILG